MNIGGVGGEKILRNKQIMNLYIINSNENIKNVNSRKTDSIKIVSIIQILFFLTLFKKQFYQRSFDSEKSFRRH